MFLFMEMYINYFYNISRCTAVNNGLLILFFFWWGLGVWRIETHIIYVLVIFLTIL